MLTISNNLRFLCLIKLSSTIWDQIQDLNTDGCWKYHCSPSGKACARDAECGKTCKPNISLTINMGPWLLKFYLLNWRENKTGFSHGHMTGNEHWQICQTQVYVIYSSFQAFLHFCASSFNNSFIDTLPLTPKGYYYEFLPDLYFFFMVFGMIKLSFVWLSPKTVRIRS